MLQDQAVLVTRVIFDLLALSILSHF